MEMVLILLDSGRFVVMHQLSTFVCFVRYCRRRMLKLKSGQFWVFLTPQGQQNEPFLMKFGL